jgi:hypothetical protein
VIRLLYFYGFLFILILGTFNHFLYNWTGKTKIGSLFFAVNESTWEHMKLIVFPYLLWCIIIYPYYKTNLNFFFSQVVGLLIMLLFIPVFFYGYRYFLQKDNFILDILDFILAIAIGEYIGYQLLINCNVSNIVNLISEILLILIIIAFLVLTRHPLNNFLFVDPITKKIGVNAQ